MLDVQLKIILKLEWKQTIINDNNWDKLIWSISQFSQVYYYNLITFLVNVNRHKAMNWLYIPFQTFKCWQILKTTVLCLIFMEKRLENLKNV